MPAAMRENMNEGEEAVKAQTRSTGLQMYTGLEGGEVDLVDIASLCYGLAISTITHFRLK